MPPPFAKHDSGLIVAEACAIAGRTPSELLELPPEQRAFLLSAGKRRLEWFRGGGSL